MKRHVLDQTKKVIRDLLASGFERSDFSVRTPKNGAGEWAETKARMLCANEKTVRLADRLAENGFMVKIYCADNAALFVRLQTFWSCGYEGGKVIRISLDWPEYLKPALEIFPQLSDAE